jgi:hypothetical protein
VELLQRLRIDGYLPTAIESVSVKHDDGTIDSFQRWHVGSKLDSTQLERLYWDEIRRVTRPITGGLFARGAGGTIGWQADGEHTAVIVQGFPPLLGGPFWRVEAWFHDVIGRRFLARVARETR